MGACLTCPTSKPKDFTKGKCIQVVPIHREYSCTEDDVVISALSPAASGSVRTLSLSSPPLKAVPPTQEQQEPREQQQQQETQQQQQETQQQETQQHSPVADRSECVSFGSPFPRDATETARDDRAPFKSAATFRPRPLLTIYTEHDDPSDDGAFSLTPFGESGKFSQTPVVAVVPFAARDSRRQTASMFQQRYGGRVDDEWEIETPNKKKSARKEGDAASPKANKSPKGKRRKTFRSFFGSGSDMKEKEDKEREKEKKREKKRAKKLSKKRGSKAGASPSAEMSREQIIQDGSNRLQRRVDKLNLLQHRVKDDGNCQFRAIAQQLLGSEEYHDIVRAHVVTYMMGVRENFDCYFESKESADVYFRELLQNGVWGDELTLRAACDSLFVNIHVLSSEQRNFYITYRPSADAPPPPAFLIDVSQLNKPLNRTNGAPQISSDSNSPQSAPAAEKLPNGNNEENDEDNENEEEEAEGNAEEEEEEEEEKGEEKEENADEGAVNANALQRRLQQRLSTSMIWPAVGPNAESAHSESAAANDSLESYKEISARFMHARTVSQDMAKFWAVGAKMEMDTGPTTLPAPVLQPVCLSHEAITETKITTTTTTTTTQTTQTIPNLALVAPTLPKSSEKGADIISSPVGARQHFCESESTNDLSMNNLSSAESNDAKYCLAFEPRTEPVDIFLSYLYPVHYNALSLPEDEGGSSSQNNSSCANGSGSARSNSLECEQQPCEVQPRAQSFSFLEFLGATFLKRIM